MGDRKNSVTSVCPCELVCVCVCVCVCDRKTERDGGQKELVSRVYVHVNYCVCVCVSQKN